MLCSALSLEARATCLAGAGLVMQRQVNVEINIKTLHTYLKCGIFVVILDLI